MSEEKKDDYEVGIPLDELPSPEPFSEDDHDAIPTANGADPQSDPADLPDLFAPEELAEVGLSADLSESVETPEDDDSPLAPETEAMESSVDLLPQEEISVAENLPEPENLSAEPSDEDGRTENQTLPESAPREVPDEPVVESDTPPTIATPDDIDSAADAASEFRPETDTDFGDQDSLIGRLESLGHQMTELRREFEGKLKYDAHKDEIIDRLHSELQEYKQDILKKYILSIVMDVVKVADDIRKWLVYFRSLEVSQRDPRKLFRYLEAIPSDLEDVFYWHGVKPYSSEEGHFDPARQRAIKKISTDDPAMDKCVAHSIRPGYEWESKVIRQEMVAVYVYQEDQESLNMGNIDE